MLQRFDVCARVEFRREGREACGSRLGARVDAALGREGSEGKLTHGPFSSFGAR